MFEQFVFIKSLVPRFLRNFIDAIRGDFNDHPEARSYTWAMVFVGFLSLGLALYAAHLGYPLYVEMLEYTAAPVIFAALLVSLVSGVIYTCSLIIGMYIVEIRKYGVSRTDGGRIQWLALLLLFMVSYDIFMNHGGQTTRLIKSKGNDIEQATSLQFSFARQGELDGLTSDIYKLEHPKESGCKGHLACRLTCPVNPRGSAHNPSGSLTRFGKELLTDKKAEKAKIEAERQIALDRFNTGAASALSEAEAVAEKKDQASKWTVLGLYLVMFLACMASASIDLAFEDAAGIALDYNALAEDQLERAQRQRDEKDRRLQEQKKRQNDRKIIARQRAKERREMRRNGLKPGKYSANLEQSPTPEINYPNVKSKKGEYDEKISELEAMISELMNKPGAEPKQEKKGKPAPDSDHLAEVEASLEEVRNELNETKEQLLKERMSRLNGQDSNGQNLNGKAVHNSTVEQIGFKRSNGSGDRLKTVETVTVSTVENGYEIICEHCQTVATMKSPRAKYCSDACRMEAYNERTKEKKLNIDGLTG
ncbi:MAG: hypothetical protein KDD04_05955 [Sinomicrobium sp.]|nr:hypothetical protein [Sinomicrobium sp.]